jgi:hypothetical protein
MTMGGAVLASDDDERRTSCEPLLGHSRTSYSSMGTTEDATTGPAQAGRSFTGDHHGIDDAAARRIMRKIDWHIIPLLFVTYVFNFMDKTILSSAAVFGLKDDNHLIGQRKLGTSPVHYIRGC